MTHGPLVSCIIIFLNAERFIHEAIESVLAQDYSHWELMLVDDGSTDGSAKIAQEYARQSPNKVRYLTHPDHENRGMSASRNLGIAHSRGDCVAFLDADDVWLPHKLGRQVKLLMSHPEAAMVYGRTQLWHSWSPCASQQDSFVSLGVAADRTVSPPHLLLILLLGKAQTPTTCNAMVRRDILIAVGAFEDSFPGMYEDQVFFSKVLLEHPVYVADEFWARYRQHEASASAFLNNFADNVVAYCAAKRPFLDWLAAYLSARGVWNPLLWLALAKEQFFCRHPRGLRTWYLLKKALIPAVFGYFRPF